MYVYCDIFIITQCFYIRTYIASHNLFDGKKSSSFKGNDDKTDCSYRDKPALKCEHGTDTICVSLCDVNSVCVIC